MAKINQPLPWETNTRQALVPISHEGTMVGFCKPEYAARIVEILNEEDKYRKALRLACYDLVARSGGNAASIQELMQKYVTRAERPKSGTGVIALLLKERQEELDLTDEEFAKFCDTFRLSRDDLRSIYAGGDIDSVHLSPLSRILGITTDELIEVWKGKD